MKNLGSIIGGLAALAAVVYLGPQLLAMLQTLTKPQLQAAGTLYDAQHNIDPSTGQFIQVSYQEPNPNVFFAQIPLQTMDNLPTSNVGS